jgi:hydrogenase expression/formation protein HypE
MKNNGRVDIEASACPVPINEYKHVQLAHGGGGTLTHQMIQRMFLPQFRNALLEPLHDGAVIGLNDTRLAFSTDSFVVNPIFFPGGDIGELAVNGTVNDLAMCGAKPLFLSVAFIIEEGLPMGDLARIVASMRRAADIAGVQIVTGDTKVVDRGKGDKIFINTSGIGTIGQGIDIAPGNARAGDVVMVNGPIAQHGMAIMAVREGLEFDSQIVSDTASLNGLVERMLAVSPRIHVLRDPTRGGIAGSLNEIAQSSKVGIRLNEVDIPVTEEVRGACEILGLDPLYVANEGKLIAIVPDDEARAVLAAMQGHPLGRESVVIGEVNDDHPGSVVMRTLIGGNRIVDVLSGEQLPRIC